MKIISILVIVLAALLILAVPAMAQPEPTCSVLTATTVCEGVYGVNLEWTAWDGAVVYWFCWQYDGNSGCDPLTSLNTGGPLGPGTFMFQVIPVDDVGAQLCESNTVTVTFPDVCEPINTPEFPSVFLPAALIIGFLGAVLLIQRTREQ